MRIIDRLVDFLSHKKITAYAFEKDCGIANGYLMKQQRGKGSLGSDILERVQQQYPDLNLIWLFTGKGKMIVPIGDELELQEGVELYGKDKLIDSLNSQIALLEDSLKDKQKIIMLLEERLKDIKD